MKILGAGMAGCLLGILNPGSKIYEAAPELPDIHRAVLRFRDNKISKATGIPFKNVKVYKTIWSDGKECKLSPRHMNHYSKKVTDKYQARSITNLDTVERYIAPGNFHLMLAEMLNGNILLDHQITGIDSDEIYFKDRDQHFRSNEPVISTIPMPILARLTREDFTNEIGTINFEHQPISVTRFKVRDADVYQTIYFPDPCNPVYRATMTGDDLIVESMGKIWHNAMIDVLHAFGFNTEDIDTDDIDIAAEERTTQQYGKISPIDDKVRRNFMLLMTQKYNIYSAGRFACWRNILLDDVYDDNFKIRAMINSDPYDVFKEASL